MSNETLKELLVSLGFKYDKSSEKAAKDFEKDVTNIKVKAFDLTVVGGVIAGLQGVIGTSIVTLTSKMAPLIVKSGELADIYKVNTSEIENFQYAYERTGLTLKDLDSTLSGITKTAKSALNGDKNILNLFEKLGLTKNDLSNDPTNLILKISKSFESLNEIQQINIADKLGISDSLPLFKKGEKNLNDLLTKARDLKVNSSKSDFINAKKVTENFKDIKQILIEVNLVIVRRFLPLLANLSDMLINIWKNYKNIVNENMIGFLDKLIFVLKILSVALAGLLLYELLNFLKFLSIANLRVAASFIAVKAAALAIPILIGLVSAALLLMIEDAKGYFNGVDSVFHDLLTKFPKLKTVLIPVVAVFATFYDLIEMSIDGLKQLFDFISNFNFEEFKKTVDYLDSVIDKKLKNSFKNIFDKGKDFIFQNNSIFNTLPENNINSSSIESRNINNKTSNEFKINVDLKNSNNISQESLENSLSEILINTYNETLPTVKA